MMAFFGYCIIYLLRQNIWFYNVVRIHSWFDTLLCINIGFQIRVFLENFEFDSLITLFQTYVFFSYFFEELFFWEMK